ncbi:MAG: hypothetical protein I8H73_19835 [Pseudomonadales bacterium]|nr:hypothetical protein [Pseudomonadales bacterium]
MKTPLSLALLACGLTISVALWWLAAAPPDAPIASLGAPSAPLPRSAALPAAPVRTAILPAAKLAKPAPPLETPPSYSLAEAQMLMQVMAEQGEPRQPAAGGLRARTAASPAQLASPTDYAAFEEQQTRAQVQAWASGVQQIPYIREQIELAAQSGTRSTQELDEARAALEQLQQLQRQLQRDAPELLPSSAGPPPVPAQGAGE